MVWPNGNHNYFSNRITVFRGRKIPELMKGLGKGVKEFKDASKGDEGVNEEESNDNEKIETK